MTAADHAAAVRAAMRFVGADPSNSVGYLLFELDRAAGPSLGFTPDMEERLRAIADRAAAEDWHDCHADAGLLRTIADHIARLRKGAA